MYYILGFAKALVHSAWIIDAFFHERDPAFNLHHPLVANEGENRWHNSQEVA